jgi:hypothetical protein
MCGVGPPSCLRLLPESFDLPDSRVVKACFEGQPCPCTLMKTLPLTLQLLLAHLGIKVSFNFDFRERGHAASQE